MYVCGSPAYKTNNSKRNCKTTQNGTVNKTFFIPKPHPHSARLLLQSTFCKGREFKGKFHIMDPKYII